MSTMSVQPFEQNALVRSSAAADTAKKHERSSKKSTVSVARSSSNVMVRSNGGDEVRKSTSKGSTISGMQSRNDHRPSPLRQLENAKPDGGDDPGMALVKQSSDLAKKSGP